MTESLIFLMRHGEIASGETRRFVGQLDLPLTDEGIRQASYWRDALAEKDFSAVYSSDLERCVRTAQIIAGSRSLALRTISEFREIALGEWQGLEVNDVKKRFPDQLRERGANLARYRTPGGESFEDLFDRVVPTFVKLVTQADGDLLIVAHQGVNRMILCHALAMPVSALLRIAQDYGCLNVISHKKGVWQTLALNLRPFPATAI